MINNDFIEWENINSYSWIHSQNAQKIVLLLEYKRQLAFLDFGVVSFKLKVAPEDRDKIESVFEKYLPNKLSQKARA